MRKSIALVTLLFVQQFFGQMAHAAIIYDWTGYCDSGCDTVSGVLTLSDSFTGTGTSNPDDFVSFKFFTPAGDYILDELVGIFSLGGYGQFSNATTTSDLILESGGVFTLYANRGGDFFASGSYSEFNKRVPEPSTIALIAIGMLAFFGLTRRKTTT